MRIVVVFPAPLGSKKPNRSPLLIAKLRFLKARNSPNFLLRFSILIMLLNPERAEMGYFSGPVAGTIQTTDVEVPGSLLQSGAGYLSNLALDVRGGIGKGEGRMVPEDGIAGNPLLGIRLRSIGILAPGSIGKIYFILQGGTIPGGNPGYPNDLLL